MMRSSSCVSSGTPAAFLLNKTGGGSGGWCGGGGCSRFSFYVIALFLLLSSSITLDSFVEAGHCWTMMNKKGRCLGPLAVRISKEDCCLGGDASTSWTPEDLDSGKFFYWMALGGGVPNCQPCKDSCKGVYCSEGKKCVLRKGQPKCICAPDCSKQKRKGPICGTDGRTYRHYCQMLKRSCRKKKQVQIAYFGPCQKSCRFLTCPGKKQCLLDQNRNPHCVRCTRQCPENRKNFVCGINGVTYNSLCHLRQAACEKGSAIPLAYFGKCKVAAKCENVRCGKRRTCLTETETGLPRCSTCQFNCKSFRLKLEGPVCATNNRTYATWCHMMQESCNTGVVIETRHSGVCEGSLSLQKEHNCISTSDDEDKVSTPKSLKSS